MPTYDELLEYILDNGLECRCCKHSQNCRGVSLGPNGPIFPPCSDHDFKDLLIPHKIRQVYVEEHGL